MFRIESGKYRVNHAGLTLLTALTVLDSYVMTSPHTQDSFFAFAVSVHGGMISYDFSLFGAQFHPTYPQ